MNTSEVLYRAADLIEERGWTTGGAGWKSAGPVCLEGGLLAALGMPWEDMTWSVEDFQSCPAYIAVSDHIAAGGELYEWNDKGGRTAAEVVEVLRACALVEAAKETADERVAATV